MWIEITLCFEINLMYLFSFSFFRLGLSLATLFTVNQVERVKRVLSTQHQARVEIESLVDGEDFSETLTRARFEEVINSHLLTDVGVRTFK